MQAYAYTVVFRDKDSKTHFYLDYCHAISLQEAKGIAHEHFEENHKDCKLAASILVKEIPAYKETNTVHGNSNARVKSEFSLPDKLA
jgi:hypothetical protein